MAEYDRGCTAGQEKERKDVIEYLRRLANRAVAVKEILYADAVDDLANAIETGVHVNEKKEIA